MDFQIFVILPAAASYQTRLRWRTSTGGIASMRTRGGCEMYARVNGAC